LTKIPRVKNGRSPGRPPEARPLPESDGPIAKIDALIVRQHGKKCRAARRRDAMTARMSLLVPDEQRTWWHYLVRCPECGRPHLGRNRELAGVTGTRKLPCRHWVVIVVARSYGQANTGAVA